MTSTNRTKRDRGAALIEFVLVLPLFLVLLLGAIDWGWFFVVRQTAINAVREGARAGSVSADAGTAATDATNAVRTYLQNTLGAGYASVAPSVDAAGCTIGATAVHCVSVTLTDFPVVPSRPDASITGLDAWTRSPTRFNVSAEMRLEVQP